jgi:hypothetical protein
MARAQPSFEKAQLALRNGQGLFVSLEKLKTNTDHVQRGESSEILRAVELLTEAMPFPGSFERLLVASMIDRPSRTNAVVVARHSTRVLTRPDSCSHR